MIKSEDDYEYKYGCPERKRSINIFDMMYKYNGATKRKKKKQTKQNAEKTKRKVTNLCNSTKKVRLIMEK